MRGQGIWRCTSLCYAIDDTDWLYIYPQKKEEMNLSALEIA